MNLWSSTILLGYLGFLSNNVQITKAQSEYAENSFLNYFNEHGNVTFTADPALLCKFMRPRGMVYLGYALMQDAYVDFSHVDGYCTADIVQCNYSQLFEGGYDYKEFFSEGPNGKYYAMASSPNQAYHWAIKERIWRPDEDQEILFYNKYQNVEDAVPFDTSEQNFCRTRTPAYARSPLSTEDVELSVKMIEYETGSTIEIETRKCGYRLPGGGTEYTYYASVSDGVYYEVRRWNFKNDEADAWVIWDRATR